MAKTKVVRGSCTVSGCSRPHKLRGFCASHAQRFRRGAPVDVAIKPRDRTPKEHCSELDCLSPVKAKGLCQAHYARLLRNGFTKKPDRTKAQSACSLAGCSDVSYSYGLCNRHYLRQRSAARFGLTLSDVEKMLSEQGGVCAICQGQPLAVNASSQKIIDFAMDHDHKTGKPRGLLCSHCNRGIGLLQDSPEIIRRAAAYLDQRSA